MPLLNAPSQGRWHPSEPDAEEVEEALPKLAPGAAPAELFRVHLLARLEVVAELLLELLGKPLVEHLQRHFPVVQEAARVEVVRANGGPDAVDQLEEKFR